MSPRPARSPVIGITLDSEPAGGYAKLPWYALRENYCDVIAAAGGLPIALPHEPELADRYLAVIDGLVVTGGAFDVDPSFYGGGDRHATVRLKERRTRFEWAITRGAVDRDLPVLGICGGQQLLNVVLGGTLIHGIIEAIEDPRRRFCLGVQWHPEYGISPGDTALIAAFITAAADR